MNIFRYNIFFPEFWTANIVIVTLSEITLHALY